MKDRHVPPRVDRPASAPPPGRDAPHAPSPPPADRNELSRTLREGFQKIADSLDNAMAGVAVVNKIQRELGRQEREHGVSSWPDGTGPGQHPLYPLAGWVYASAEELADIARRMSDILESNGELDWLDILLEAVLKAAAQDDDLESSDLDDELVRVGAVVVAWVKDRERRRQRRADLAEKGYDPTEGPAPDLALRTEGDDTEEPVVVDESPSLFPDAGPVRTYLDGSQSYGPYQPGGLFGDGVK